MYSEFVPEVGCSQAGPDTCLSGTTGDLEAAESSDRLGQGSRREESVWYSQKGAALGPHGPAYQLLVPGTIRRVTEVIELFYSRAAQQTGSLVGEGVKGELAMVPAHPTVACKDTQTHTERESMKIAPGQPWETQSLQGSSEKGRAIK